MWGFKKAEMPSRQSALPGRAAKMPVPAEHYVNGAPLEPPFPSGLELAMFGLGCFWGAERKFWQMPGVFSTSAGYAAGFTPNATYEEVCSGRTGHNEVVRVVFLLRGDPDAGVTDCDNCVGSISPCRDSDAS